MGHTQILERRQLHPPSSLGHKVLGSVDSLLGDLSSLSPSATAPSFHWLESYPLRLACLFLCVSD